MGVGGDQLGVAGREAPFAVLDKVAQADGSGARGAVGVAECEVVHVVGVIGKMEGRHPKGEAGLGFDGAVATIRGGGMVLPQLQAGLGGEVAQAALEGGEGVIAQLGVGAGKAAEGVATEAGKAVAGVMVVAGEVVVEAAAHLGLPIVCEGEGVAAVKVGHGPVVEAHHLPQLAVEGGLLGILAHHGGGALVAIAVDAASQPQLAPLVVETAGVVSTREITTLRHGAVVGGVKAVVAGGIDELTPVLLDHGGTAVEGGVAAGPKGECALGVEVVGAAEVEVAAVAVIVVARGGRLGGSEVARGGEEGD